MMIRALMNLFKTKKEDKPFDAVALSKSLEEIIEKNVKILFKKHLKTLIKEENDYIVYAVWGAKIDGVLSDEQKEIYNTIIPVINELLSITNVETLSESQKYAIEYLIRGLFISKIIYMIEFVKNKILETNKDKSNKQNETETQIDELLNNLNKNISSSFPKKDGNEGFKRW